MLLSALKALQEAWTDELQEAEGTPKFLNAVQNYPLLKGVQTNLYKCFMPLAWGLNSSQRRRDWFAPS
jgi:hypothetical protein